MSLGKTASSSARWTAASSVITTTIGIMQVAFLARILQPEDFGTLAFLAIILAFCDVFVRVGFSDVLVVKQDSSSVQLSTMYWINLFVGLLVYTVFFALAPLLPFMFDISGVELMARVIGINILIGSTTVQFHALMRREFYFPALSIISVAEALFGMMVALFLAFEGFGVWSLIYSRVATQIFRCVALFLFAIRKRWLPGLEFELSAVVEYLRFGMYRIGAALVNNLNARADQLAIGVFIGPVALGYYNMAFSVAVKPLTKINPVLTQVIVPVFSKLRADKSTMLKGYRKSLRLLMFVNAPLLLGYAAVAPEFLPLLIGPGWQAAVDVSRVLVIAMLFRSAANINIGLILANEKYRWPFYWNLFLLLIIPAIIAMVSVLSGSLMAVSVSITIAQIALFICGYFLFARNLLEPFGRQFIDDFGRPVGIAVLMATSVCIMQAYIVTGSAYVDMFLAIALGAALYAGYSLLIQRSNVIEMLRL